MSRGLALAALTGVALAGASPAISQDRRSSTEWVPEALVSGGEIEARQDRAFLRAEIGPRRLVVVDEPVRTGAGEELAPAGTRFFRLRTQRIGVFCSTSAARRWGGESHIVVVYLCLVDDDGDDRPDSYYVERGDHAFLPVFRGVFPAERRALTPLGIRTIPSDQFSLLADGSRPPEGERFSLFLRWSGRTIQCYVGYPRHRILHVPLEVRTAIPRAEALPATVTACGARLRLLSRENGVLRLVVESGYPQVPFEIGVPWQLF